MLQRAVLASLVLGFTLAVPGIGLVAQQGKGKKEESVDLQWKLKEGDTFFVEERITAKTVVTVNGKKTTEEQVQHRFSRFLVKPRQRGDIVLEQHIESWKSQIVGGLAGDKDDTKLMQKLTANLAFEIQMSPGGAIKRFLGYDEFLKRLAKDDEAEARKFKAAVGEEVLLTPLAQIFDIMPPAGIKKGKQWKRDNRVPMGPMGTFELATTFTYKGLGENGAEIDTKATMTWVPGTVEAGELGFKIQKLDLTKKDVQGQIVFDIGKGRLVLRKTTLPLAGTMVLELPEAQVQVQFEGSETRTIQMMDNRPV